MNNLQKPFEGLTPEVVLSGVETLAGQATGAIMALNSYENRVYEVQMEQGEPIIAKFYRPGRWQREAILEEHHFTHELASEEVDVVAPLIFKEKTLFEEHGYYYSLSPKRAGRPFEVRKEEDLRQLGRLMGRFHLISGREKFQYRRYLDVTTSGYDHIKAILTCPLCPPELHDALEAIMNHVLGVCADIWQAVKAKPLRLHGDAHAGNILVTDLPFMVDMDDCLTGPAIQDLWMLAAGQFSAPQRELALVIEGYETFKAFQSEECQLVEPLRTLRMLQYTAWLANRWHDPTFPKNFPFFAEVSYWQNLITNLQQQLALLMHPQS